jgi:subtilisin family serine protease
MAGWEGLTATGASSVSPAAMAGALADQALAQAFESLQVLEVKPYFIRPEGKTSSRQELRLSRIFQALYVSGVDAGDAAVALAATPSVRAASSVPLRVVAGLPNDPKFGLQWGFHQKGDFDMDLPEAWDVSVGDSAIVVAIVDTGLDRYNPDLGGPTLWDSGNVWVNTVEASGEEGVDDDSNGYVDDFWGWDWVDYRDGSPQPWPGEDDVEEDNDPYDFHGHGTAVAGVIGALGNNAEGVAGFLWRCKIMGLRAGLTVRVQNERLGIVRMDWCARAVVYAADMDAAAINASWESGYDVGLEAAVDYAISKGVVMAVSAGNRGTSNPDSLKVHNYLSTRGDCIDVGGVQIDGVRWTGSNYGPWVDVSAPATSIMTLGFRPPDTRGYWYSSGTSFAAPAVAALAALLRHEHPDWSTEQIRRHLMETSVPLSPPDPGAGAGLVNAFNAIKPPYGGWGLLLDGVLETPAVPVEGRKGTRALAAGLSGGRAGAWSVTGQPLEGWPVTLGGGTWGGVASADLNGDGEAEIVLVDGGGRVAALGLDGSTKALWDAGSAPAGEPVLADLDGDGSCEVLLAAQNQSVHAWNGDGVPMSGWPVHVNALPAGAPAVGDMDGDGSLEIVVACDDGTMYCLSAGGEVMPGWPVSAAAGFAGPASLGEVEGDDGRLEAIAAGKDGYLYGWDWSGMEVSGLPCQVCVAGATGGVSLGDIDADGVLEAAVVCSDRKIAVCDARGFLEEGWPIAAGGQVRDVLFSDVDGDSSSDIVAAIGGVGVMAWDASGAAIANWPKPTDGTPTAGAALGDFDNDGRTEIIAPSGAGWLRCWDLSAGPYFHAGALWPLFAKTPGNTRLASLSAGIDVPTGGQGFGAVSPFRITLVWASPNPFRVSTQIISRVEGPEDERRPAVLEIFDVSGRLVRRIAHSARNPGLYGDAWDGKNDLGAPAAPGVYFCRVRVGNAGLCCRVVLLR